MADNQKKISASDELALDALSQTNQEVEAEDEVNKSNELAETLTSLQNLIEKHARELIRIEAELKEKRQSLKSVFDNDVQLVEARDEVDRHAQVLKERKMQLQNDPQSTSLKIDIAELNQQKKELEETLSNHLVNYHSLTNSMSFDTSDGDQWDFSIKAKIKPKKL
ncbi:MAG TPA: hypothetical protein PLQ50_01640 [Candidatus Woesebacteria bacterium]|nr:hypothetical protein [Candidatus Woesebacteria bacterium]